MISARAPLTRLKIDLPGAHAGGFQRKPKSLFALAQRGFGRDPGGDVPNDADHEMFTGDLGRLRDDLDWEDRAVAPAMSCLEANALLQCSVELAGKTREGAGIPEIRDRHSEQLCVGIPIDVLSRFIRLGDRAVFAKKEHDVARV